MKNWTIKDAVAVIQNGKDIEAIKELAKHFPMFFMAVAKNDLGAVAAMMTDKMTVRRLQVEDAATDEDENDATEAETDTEDEAEDAGSENLEGMSTKQLIALCGKRGIKVPKYGKNKQFYIDALSGGSDDGADDEDAGEDEDEAEADPYAGKNAVQLYSICKKRGLKVAPKQKAAVYLEALRKADAKSAEAEDAADDDWDDDEEEQPKSKTGKTGGKTKAGATKGAKGKTEKASKSSKNADASEDAGDDDDDWEI